MAKDNIAIKQAHLNVKCLLNETCITAVGTLVPRTK